MCVCMCVLYVDVAAQHSRSADRNCCWHAERRAYGMVGTGAGRIVRATEITIVVKLGDTRTPGGGANDKREHRPAHTTTKCTTNAHHSIAVTIYQNNKNYLLRNGFFFFGCDKQQCSIAPAHIRAAMYTDFESITNAQRSKMFSVQLSTVISNEWRYARDDTLFAPDCSVCFLI